MAGLITKNSCLPCNSATKRSTFASFHRIKIQLHVTDTDQKILCGVDGHIEEDWLQFELHIELNTIPYIVRYFFSCWGGFKRIYIQKNQNLAHQLPSPVHLCTIILVISYDTIFFMSYKMLYCQICELAPIVMVVTKLSCNLGTIPMTSLQVRIVFCIIRGDHSRP